MILERFGIRVGTPTSVMETLAGWVYTRETFSMCSAAERLLLENCGDLERVGGQQKMKGVEQKSLLWLTMSCPLSRETWQKEQVSRKLRK